MKRTGEIENTEYAPTHMHFPLLKTLEDPRGMLNKWVEYGFSRSGKR